MARGNIVDDDDENGSGSEDDQDFDAENEDSDTSPKKGHKRRKSVFIDDAASEEDDEDEGEDDSADAKRKAKKRNRFIDDIAAVDDEEDEDDDEDEVDDLIGDEATEAADQEQVQAAIAAANLKARDEDIDPEALEQFIKDRFKAPQHVAASDFSEEGGMVSQNALLPSHSDPRLWLVETRTGQEREACIRLMQKSIDYADKGQNLAITSCFVQDHLQGYMYVEAFKESHVLEAIRGLRNVLISKGAKLIPLDEMKPALDVNTKAQKAIDDGSWVRMRRYPYQGDPAKVLTVDSASQRAVIKFVPRIDYAELVHRNNTTSNLTEDGTLKRKAIKKIGGVRPSAKVFSKEEATRNGFHVASSDNQYTIAGVGNFEDGYEIKWVSMRNIVLDDLGPTVEELTRYNKVMATARQNTVDAAPEAGNDELLESLVNADVVIFAKGDKVKVIEGDLQGLWGYVHAVRDNNVIEILPQLKELTEILPLPPSHLAKTFEVGDHVKVTGGQHSGQSGMVVAADDRVCTLVSDSTKQELNCFTKDLSERVDVAMGLDTFGKYELHDLVVLDQQTTGIIVSVEKETCRVLTTEGTADNPKVRICRLPDIKRKFPENRKITAPDANGNSISVADIVTIRDGSFAGRSGVVKFVVRGSVFIQSRDVTRHSGFICLRSRAVVVKGAKAPANGVGRFDPSKMLRSPAPHRFADIAGNGGPVLASPMRHSAPGFGGGFGRGIGGASGGFGGRGGSSFGGTQGRPDRIIGSSITIARGPYKGYKGRVVNATETHVRMELEAQYKTVTVPRTVLPMADGGVPESANRPPGINIPRTPGYGAPQTPAYGAGNRTPMHAWGSRTPMHPGMTPSHPGSATPMHDSAWAAGPTPCHPSLEEDQSDKYRDLGTPYTPADTPSAGIVSTPGLDAGTPSFGYGTASTPGLDAQTPSIADPYLPTPAGTGATPAMASIPAYTNSSGSQPENSKARLYQHLLVTIPAQNSQAGRVKSVDANGQLVVELGTLNASNHFDVNAGTTILSVGEVKPMPPRKGDALRILEGNEAGKEGTLSSIADHEGVVKLDRAIRQNEDVVVVNMTSIGRLARGE